jgi:hypothetical protein
MKGFTLPVFIFLSAPLFICAQKIRKDEFQITLPEQKIQNSLYSSIRFIDARYDTTSVGIIQRGALNLAVRLVTRQPLKEQAESTFMALTDSTAKAGELILMMRQFSLVEFAAGVLGQKGYCYIRADLFGGNNGSYKLLSSFDSVVVVKSQYDVTKELLKTGSEVLTGFIAGSLLKEPVETEALSLNDIFRIDSLEKRSLAIYNTDVYKDGIYRTFRSFIDQTPDGQIAAKVKKGEIWDIFTFNKKGKKEKVWQKDTYAVIYNGVPYISTEFDYYLLHKKDGDFYFTGKARAIVFSADAIVTSILFLGLLGSLLMPYYGEATFDMKIDHLNGGFIRLRRVKN